MTERSQRFQNFVTYEMQLPIAGSREDLKIRRAKAREIRVNINLPSEEFPLFDQVIHLPNLASQSLKGYR